MNLFCFKLANTRPFYLFNKTLFGCYKVAFLIFLILPKNILTLGADEMRTRVSWCECPAADQLVWIVLFLFRFQENPAPPPRRMSRTEVRSTSSSTTLKTSPKFDDGDASVGVPTDVPSILELKRILPKHCFQVSSLYNYWPSPNYYR